jgi:DNA replication protein DnaC
MTSHEQILSAMKTLKLPSMRRELDECIRLAEAKGLSYLEFLRGLFGTEIRGREESSRRTRRAAAHFPVQKNLDDFDFSFQKSVKKARVINLAECRWVEHAGNILFAGPPGIGKTHLAIGLGLKAIEKGYRVRFFHADDLFEEMYVHAASGEVERYLRKILRNDCIVVDEFGYLPLDANAGNYLYKLINGAYERISLVITSNKDVETWGEMFQDQAIAQAILDRFLHHCEVFKMAGESYRLKSSQDAGSDTGKEARKRREKD